MSERRNKASVLKAYLSFVAARKGKMTWYKLGVLSGVPKGAMNRVRRANLILGRMAKRWYESILDTLFIAGHIGKEEFGRGLDLVREVLSRETAVSRPPGTVRRRPALL